MHWVSPLLRHLRVHLAHHEKNNYSHRLRVLGLHVLAQLRRYWSHSAEVPGIIVENQYDRVPVPTRYRPG